MRIKRTKIIRAALLLMLIAAAGLMLCGCSWNSVPGSEPVYEDMKASFEKAGLLSANIGIFSRTDSPSGTGS